jgi:outer membrane biosynthesis protein TonB
MTTAEFIIGHSADDAVERKQEVRKIFWALLAALVVHLAIACSIAVFGGMLSSPFSVAEEKPIELTFVDLATPAPATQKNTMFMETDESKQSKEPPKEKTFESNANSIAGSQNPATGSLPLPSQQGKDRPSVDLETHPYTLPNDGAQPQPSAKPQESPQPSVAPTPQSTPVTDQLALLTSTPRPSVQPTVASKPQQPKSSYRPLKEQTRISGSISNRGISSVNALGTPLGRYNKIITDSIGSRWYNYMDQRRELANIGTLQVHFFIDRSGHVKNLKIVENTSNEAFANICLQSILEAQLPPIPEDLANNLPPEGLEVEGMNFVIFP